MAQKLNVQWYIAAKSQSIHILVFTLNTMATLPDCSAQGIFQAGQHPDQSLLHTQILLDSMASRTQSLCRTHRSLLSTSVSRR